ncbi:MAG: serine/threonine protein kinase [Myxococcales bacterium]|nr:serine/threonine protein kinase [Myxococcales bacterium]
MKALAERFHQLTPDQVIGAVERAGHACTGRAIALNSYENRVYQVERADGEWLVGKFYRPGRWSVEALDDEHDFIYALDDAGVPVVVPLDLDGDGGTIGTLTGEAEGIHYALYPRVRGRPPEEFNDEQLDVIGRALAELHDVGDEGPAPARPVLDPDTYGRAELEWLLRHDALPREVRDGYAYTVEALLDRIAPLFADVPLHRIHGDCHPGNLLWTPSGPVFLDFDDMRIGPAAQDVWMLVPSYDKDGDRQRARLLDAYREVRDFPGAWLDLVEPLRALRFVHYSAWIARRWKDPVFQRTFGHFGDIRYWQREIDDLREQIARIDARCQQRD